MPHGFGVLTVMRGPPENVVFVKILGGVDGMRGGRHKVAVAEILAAASAEKTRTHVYGRGLSLHRRLPCVHLGCARPRRSRLINRSTSNDLAARPRRPLPVLARTARDRESARERDEGAEGRP